MKKFCILVFSAIYTAMSAGLASAAEASLWKERRAARVQLASLPATLETPLRRDLMAAPARETPTGERAVRATSGAPAWFASDAVAPYATVDRVDKAPASAGPRRTAILIEDIHQNGEAQRSLSGLIASLDRAARQRHERLRIGVEGATGSFSFARFLAFPNKEFVRAVADHLLARNLIAAPSHAALTAAGFGSDLIGVEDRTDYEANVRAYLEARRSQPRAKAMEADLRREVAPKVATLRPALRSFLEDRDRVWSGSLRFTDWIAELATAIEQRNGGALPRDLARFVSAIRIERRLDFARVERERDAVVRTLVRVSPPAELAALLNRASAYRRGDLSYGAFYRSVGDAVARAGLSLAPFPAFRDYLSYVQLSDGIDGDALFRSADDLEMRALDRLAPSASERAVAAELDEIHLFSKLTNFGLTPELWTRYRRDHRGLPRLAAVLSGFDLKPFEAFYEAADRRSAGMVDRLTAGAAALPALVVGGFHAKDVSALLCRRGFDVVVLQPRLRRLDSADAAGYLSMFAREKTPIERLFEGQKLFLAPSWTALGAGEKTPSAIPVERLFTVLVSAGAALAHPDASIDALVPQETGARVDGLSSGAVDVRVDGAAGVFHVDTIPGNGWSEDVGAPFPALFISREADGGKRSVAALPAALDGVAAAVTSVGLTSPRLGMAAINSWIVAALALAVVLPLALVFRLYSPTLAQGVGLGLFIVAAGRVVALLSTLGHEGAHLSADGQTLGWTALLGTLHRPSLWQAFALGTDITNASVRPTDPNITGDAHAWGAYMRGDRLRRTAIAGPLANGVLALVGVAVAAPALFLPRLGFPDAAGVLFVLGGTLAAVNVVLSVTNALGGNDFTVWRTGRLIGGELGRRGDRAQLAARERDELLLKMRALFPDWKDSVTYSSFEGLVNDMDAAARASGLVGVGYDRLEHSLEMASFLFDLAQERQMDRDGVLFYAVLGLIHDWDGTREGPWNQAKVRRTVAMMTRRHPQDPSFLRFYPDADPDDVVEDQALTYRLRSMGFWNYSREDGQGRYGIDALVAGVFQTDFWTPENATGATPQEIEERLNALPERTGGMSREALRRVGQDLAVADLAVSHVLDPEGALDRVAGLALQRFGRRPVSQEDRDAVARIESDLLVGSYWFLDQHLSPAALERIGISAATSRGRALLDRWSRVQTEFERESARAVRERLRAAQAEADRRRAPVTIDLTLGVGWPTPVTVAAFDRFVRDVADRSGVRLDDGVIRLTRFAEGARRGVRVAVQPRRLSFAAINRYFNPFGIRSLPSRQVDGALFRLERAEVWTLFGTTVSLVVVATAAGGVAASIVGATVGLAVGLLLSVPASVAIHRFFVARHNGVSVAPVLKSVLERFSPAAPKNGDGASLAPMFDWTDARIDEVIDTWRVDSNFRFLPEHSAELRAFVRELIAGGALVQYERGENLYEKGRGRYHLILNGEVRQVAVTNVDVDPIAGPYFGRGAGLGAWAVAGQNGSPGVMRVVQPVIALTLTAPQYERLVRLTFPGGQASQQRAVSAADIAELEEFGFVGRYRADSRDFAFLRGRDAVEALIQTAERGGVPAVRVARMRYWARIIRSYDFLVTAPDGAGRLVTHPIQHSIKNAFENRRLLKENYLFVDDYFTSENGISRGAPALKSHRGEPLSNAESLALYRNIERATPRTSESLDEILFVRLPGRYMMDNLDPIPAQCLLTFAGGHRVVLEPQDLPLNGVLDPAELAAIARAKARLGNKVALRGWSVVDQHVPGIEWYRLDVNAYRDDVDNTGEYSIGELVRQMRLHYMRFVEPAADEPDTAFLSREKAAVDEFSSLVSDANQLLLANSGLGHTDLSHDYRRDLVALLGRWVATRREGRSNDPVLVDPNEVGMVLALYLENLDERRPGSVEWSGRLAGYRDLLLSERAKSATKAHSPAYTNALTAFTAFQRANTERQRWSSSKDAEIRRLGDWRNTKTAFNAGSEQDEDREPVDTVLVPLDAHMAGEWDAPDFHGTEGDFVIIPDRHENIWALEHELRQFGVTKADGSLDVATMAGKKVLQIGDNVNRFVGPAGLAMVDLWLKLYEQASAWNAAHPKPNERITIQILLGNHELDLLGYGDEKMKAYFPSVGERANAELVRRKLRHAIKIGLLTAGALYGDPNGGPESDLVAVHAGVDPLVESRVLDEMRARRPDLPQNDAGLVAYINQILRNAVGADDLPADDLLAPWKSDFSHFIFSKSTLRGGKEAGSGFIELDMGSWTNFKKGGNDLAQIALRSGAVDADFRRTGDTQQTMQKNRAYAPRRRVAGHSFSTGDKDGHLDVRTARFFDADGQPVIFPTFLVLDGGINQADLEHREEGTDALVYKDGRFYVAFTVTQPKRTLPKSQAEVQFWKDASAGRVTNARAKEARRLQNGVAGLAASTPVLEKSIDRTQMDEVARLYRSLSTGLNPEPPVEGRRVGVVHPRNIAVLVSQLLEPNDGGDPTASVVRIEKTGPLPARADEYWIALQGGFLIGAHHGSGGTPLVIPHEGDFGTGRLLTRPGEWKPIDASAGSTVLVLRDTAANRQRITRLIRDESGLLDRFAGLKDGTSPFSWNDAALRYQRETLRVDTSADERALRKDREEAAPKMSFIHPEWDDAWDDRSVDGAPALTLRATERTFSFLPRWAVRTFVSWWYEAIRMVRLPAFYAEHFEGGHILGTPFNRRALAAGLFGVVVVALAAAAQAAVSLPAEATTTQTLFRVGGAAVAGWLGSHAVATGAIMVAHAAYQKLYVAPFVLKDRSLSPVEIDLALAVRRAAARPGDFNENLAGELGEMIVPIRRILDDSDVARDAALQDLIDRVASDGENWPTHLASLSFLLSRPGALVRPVAEAIRPSDPVAGEAVHLVLTGVRGGEAEISHALAARRDPTEPIVVVAETASAAARLGQRFAGTAGLRVLTVSDERALSDALASRRRVDVLIAEAAAQSDGFSGGDHPGAFYNMMASLEASAARGEIDLRSALFVDAALPLVVPTNLRQLTDFRVAAARLLRTSA